MMGYDGLLMVLPIKDERYKESATVNKLYHSMKQRKSFIKNKECSSAILLPDKEKTKLTISWMWNLWFRLAKTDMP